MEKVSAFERCGSEGVSHTRASGIRIFLRIKTQSACIALRVCLSLLRDHHAAAGTTGELLNRFLSFLSSRLSGKFWDKEQPVVKKNSCRASPRKVLQFLHREVVEMPAFLLCEELHVDKYFVSRSQGGACSVLVTRREFARRPGFQSLMAALGVYNILSSSPWCLGAVSLSAVEVETRLCLEDRRPSHDGRFLHFCRLSILCFSFKKLWCYCH